LGAVLLHFPVGSFWCHFARKSAKFLQKRKRRKSKDVLSFHLVFARMDEKNGGVGGAAANAGAKLVGFFKQIGASVAQPTSSTTTGGANTGAGAAALGAQGVPDGLPQISRQPTITRAAGMSLSSSNLSATLHADTTLVRILDEMKSW
jgi:hypothetical protein